MKNKPSSLKSNSLIVMVCTMLSRLLGVIRIRVFGSVYGASSLADAINFSFNIPNNFRKLFAEGALSNALVPTFVNIHEDKERTQRLFSSFLALQLIISLLIIAFTLVFKKPLVLFLSDFSSPDQNYLAIRLLPYFATFLVFILLSSYFSAVLQSKNLFLIQAIAPLCFSIAVITCILVFNKQLGPLAMAVGTILGALMQALLTFINLKKIGIKFCLNFDFKNEDFLIVLKKWAPAIISSAIAIFSSQIAYYFASSMDSGSVSAFSNSLIFWQTPYGVFYTTIGTVFFPLLSKQKGKELADTYTLGLNRLSNFLIPAAIFLFFFRYDAVAVVLLTGKFTLVNSLLTSKVLGYYLIGMIFVAYYSFTTKLCYSLNKPRLALYSSLVVTIADIIITIILINQNLGIVSLPIANTFAHLGGLLFLFFTLVKTKTEFKLKPFIIHQIKVILIAIPLIIYCLVLKHLLPSYWKEGSSLINLTIFSAISLIAIAIVLLVNKLAKNEVF